MARPLLSLVCILKDEVKSIRALLESVYGTVDHATILDTGSTDGTQEVIREFSWCQLCEEPVFPFDGIKDRKVIDYAKTRNRALELEAARPDAAVFTFFLSGDEVLENGATLREQLEKLRDAPDGAYCVQMRDKDKSWPYPRVLRVDSKWRYDFPIQESPMSPDGQETAPSLDGVSVFYKGGDATRFFKRLREVDIPVLTYMVNAQVETHRDHLRRARAILYLGQTHEHLAAAFPKGDPTTPWLTHQMLAMSYYKRRAELEGDSEEVHFSLFHFFNLIETLGIYTDEEILARLEPLAEIAPRRPEIRYMIAAHHASLDVRQGMKFALEAAKVAREAQENPLPLPVAGNVEWLSLRLAAECAKVMEKLDQARELAERGVACGGPKEAFQAYL